MGVFNWLIEIVLFICLIALVSMKADVRVVVMVAIFYFTIVIREEKGKTNERN